MSNEDADEKRLKQCLQSIIDSVSKANEQSQNGNDSQQIINNLRQQIKNILDRSLSKLSKKCRNYLLNIFYEYDFDEQTNTLPDSFTIDILESFGDMFEGCLQSIDVFHAAWNGEQSVVEEFVEKYPHLIERSGLYETTLLYSAARNNHMNLVRYLVEDVGFSVNTKNEEYLQKGQTPTANKATIGSTPLHAACYQGHLDIVKFLIAHGGDYYMKNSANETPIENAKSKSSIQQFFKDFLISTYSTNSTSVLTQKILDKIEDNPVTIIDCIWEYKPIAMNQWIPFSSDIAKQLQESMNEKSFPIEIQLKSGRDRHLLSLAQFLRLGSNPAWIRCRGSSLLNFHCYGQWQLMFIKHPTGTINPKPSTEVFDINTYENIQFNSWYTVDNELNIIFETAMNYQRRFVNMYMEVVDEQITLNFENFSFSNQLKTIEGFLRWIPKLILDESESDINPVNNFELTKDMNVSILTISRVKQRIDDESFEEYYDDPYDLSYKTNIFCCDNDEIEFANKKSTNEHALINVIEGDLLTETTDVIVICSSSKFLMDAVFNAGGRSLKANYEKKAKDNNKDPVISIPAEGSLSSKAVYFVPWKPSSQEDRLRQSLEQLVQNVIQKATKEKFQSIAFPAIGCGGYGCSTSIIAETLTHECQQLVTKYPISIIFNIQPGKSDIYNEFRQRIDEINLGNIHVKEPPISLSIGNGNIEVKKGDITKQKVDVIIGSLSSENLLQIILKAAGYQTQTAFVQEQSARRNASIIKTPSGHLQCKQIFFFKWEPKKDKKILQQSLVDLIANIVQHVKSDNYTSIAFPALGCGEHDCSIDIIVKTIVKEMKQQIEKNKLSWTVKFIIHPSQQTVYDEFCRQVLSSDLIPNDYQLPNTWERSNDEDQMRFLVPENSDEYKSIINKFDQEMQGNYQNILKLERIQNERWYMQYVAHRKDFKKRLGIDTEKRLYHGCPGHSVDPIINDCFNRSYAGVNGTVYGVGVYFSSRATYSNGYAQSDDETGEQHMFVCRVLAGKTTKGDSSMQVRPIGFDSTTDGIHMTVTYHDAQAYAEYLITYN